MKIVFKYVWMCSVREYVKEKYTIFLYLGDTISVLCYARRAAVGVRDLHLMYRKLSVPMLIGSPQEANSIKKSTLFRASSTA